MGTTPTTVNQPATIANGLISTIGDGLVTMAEKLAEAQVPFLAFPGIKQLFEALVGWICGFFIKALEDESTYLIIKIEVAAEESQIGSASKQLILAQQSGDQVQIEKALILYAAAISSLIHFDGSAPAKG